MVQCPHCGQENPPQYRFCGMCGKSITGTPAPPKQAAPLPPKLSAPTPPAPVKEPAPIVREVPREVAREANKPQDVPFSGPSFLGLSGGSSESSGEYLLEDEAQSSGRGKMLIALLLLLVAAGLLGWKWHFGSYPWQSASSAPAATTAQPNAENTPAAPNNSGAPAAPNAADSSSAQTAAPPAAQNAAPAQSTNSSGTPAPDASATNSSAANPTDEAVGKAATTDSTPASQPAADDQAAQKPAAQKPEAQLKQTAPAPRAAPRKVAMAEEDSPESEAQALLTQGERYLNGNGVPQNCGRAQDSLRSAADRGSFQAIDDLATMYSTGHCVKKDLPTAYRWFVKALHQQPSNSRISTDLQVLWNQMSPEEKQVAMQK